MAVPGTNDGTSSLTVDSAAEALTDFISDDLDVAEHREPAKPHTPPTGEDESEAPEPEEESASAEEEGEEEESEGEEEQDEEETPAPRTHRVKVDGAEVEVTEDELLKGYSRTQDYTRKTQALAEQRKAAETELTAVRAERQQYATQLQQLAAVLDASAPEVTDWATLRAEDPAEFAARYAEYHMHQERVRNVMVEQARVAQQVTEDQARQHVATLETETQKLLEAIPAWKNAETAKKEKGEVAKYAMEKLGYTEEQLKAVTDHRAMVLIHKAMLFDRLQAKKPVLEKAVAGKTVPVAKPGSAASTRPKTSALTKQKQRLAKTGRVEDAASVFESLID